MLSKKTKYAINALVYLAKKPYKEPVLISEIAEKEHIPKKFLETILLDLRNAGILNSKKGKGGGYYLIKDPKDINMADVYRTLEGPIALLPCVSHNFYEKCENCNENHCSLHDVLIEVRDATLSILEKKSLIDLKD